MTKAIIAGLGLTVIILGLYILYKARRMKEINDKIFEKQLIKDSDPLSLQTIESLGFRIYDTKDKIYAINTKGVSIDDAGSGKVKVNLRDNGEKHTAIVSTIGELKEFCKTHNKPIHEEKKESHR